MRDIVKVFDLFKLAFNINTRNKYLYKPQIIYFAIESIFILFIGVGIYSWIFTKNNLIGFFKYKWDRNYFFIIIVVFISICLLILLSIVGKTILEAGLLSLYKKTIMCENKQLTFLYGVKKYFWKLVLGDIIVNLFWILAFIPYIIFGLMTFSIGLTIIPLGVNVFISFWKVVLVIEDCNTIDAFKKSIQFVKKNFTASILLNIIYWSWLGGATSAYQGSGGIQNGFNIFNNIENMNYRLPYIDYNRFEIINYLKIGLSIVIILVAIAHFIISIIVMVFNVFFMLTFFLVYINDFNLEVVDNKYIEMEKENELV